jgi:hypothetical protein
MWFRVIIVTWACVSFLAGITSAETCSFQLDIPAYKGGKGSGHGSGFYSIPGQDYPVAKIRFLLIGEVSNVQISSRLSDSIEVDAVPELSADIPTDAEGVLDQSALTGGSIEMVGRPAVAVAGVLHLEDVTVVDVWVAPYMQDAVSRSIWFASQFEIDIDAPVEAFSVDFGTDTGSDQTGGQIAIELMAAVTQSLTGSSSASLLSLSETLPEYVIITAESLAEAFLPLVRWKNQLGYTASVMTTEDIYSQYEGIDEAEQIRNYLKVVYAGGTRWVLLGGDETVVPIRYAYHLNKSEAVPLDKQQICDLYYADLTGEWDVDGDGLYGEPGNDSPDKTPELMLGRALVDTPTEVQMFVRKCISYEKDPAQGDPEFANQVLVSSADQMRDYATVGQDSLIATELPPHLDVDRWSLAESPSGSDDAPQSPAGTDFVLKLSDGYNLTFVLAHGNADGFVTRAKNYNEWPKSYVFTREEAPPGHASIHDLTNYDRFGIVYSVGCNNGAFDMDSPPFTIEFPCMAEKFLLDSLSGAAAFIGYSRWGWVGSSYQLMIDFNECIYNSDNRLAPANNFSKASNHFLTDLVYGLNVYGDPSLRVWTDMPEPISVDAPSQIDFGGNNFVLTIVSDSRALDSAVVTVVGANGILFAGFTDANGQVEVAFELESDTSVTLTVSKLGHLPAENALSPVIALDADDESGEGDPARPVAYKLGQNYPNPFNPSTTIEFDLLRASDVRIDVYNVLGQLVENVVDEYLSVGAHEAVIESAAWPGGIYFYRLQASGFVDVKKMVLLK